MTVRRSNQTGLFSSPPLSLKRIIYAVGLVTLIFTNVTCSGNRANIEENAKIKAAQGTNTGMEENAKIKAASLEKKDIINPYGPPAPPGKAITRSEIKTVDTSGRESMDDAITCLARTIYWEARGRDRRVMHGVANVVMNRLRNGGFPDSICGIVKQGSEKKGCQFSWWCDGRPDSAQEAKPYETSKEIARKALNRQLKDLTGGALYFHGKGVKPSWEKDFIKTIRIDGLTFYRPPRRQLKKAIR
jgi:spore germination cell wall hydrolase CwlJ-like protein